MSKIVGIIPARYASQRLPAKALAEIEGKPMVQRVYEQACKSASLAKVVVATDDNRIAQAIRKIGGEAIMTDVNHWNGTERSREALDSLADEYDYVINIQGDEPFIQPKQLDELANLLDGEVQLATLVKRIEEASLLFNPSIMKVIFDKNMNALYFSRECIPHLRGVDRIEWHLKGIFYKHVAIYAYRSDILREITPLLPTPLEQSESLEQLRWLENGYPIRIGITEIDSFSVDTPADLEKARRHAQQL